MPVVMSAAADSAVSSLKRWRPKEYPVWETTHVGGHRFAPNLVIFPHGLYYGPVDAEGAIAAIEAHRNGAISARGFRGRSGVPAVGEMGYV